MVSGFRRNCRVGSKRQPVWSYSKMTGAIEAISSAAMVQLNGRVTRGSVSRRLSEAPTASRRRYRGL